MKALILERLHADHYRYVALLCILDRQLHIVACEEQPDYPLLAGLYHYLTRQPEEWHHRVEDQLYACLAKRQPESRELLEVLTEEHHRIAGYGRELEAKARRLAESPAPEMDLNTRNLARAFSELYHHHLHTENRRVFPLLERQFPKAVLEDLAFAPLTAPAEGSVEFQQLYRQIAERHTGLQLGHGELASFCPVCNARPEAGANR